MDLSRGGGHEYQDKTFIYWTTLTIKMLIKSKLLKDILLKKVNVSFEAKEQMLLRKVSLK